MKLNKNNNQISVFSDLFNTVGTYKLTVDKNCCNKPAIFNIESTSLNGSSNILVEDNIYHPLNNNTKLFSITFLNTQNNTTYVFQPTLYNIHTNFSNIITAYNTWKTTLDIFNTSTISFTENNLLTDISIEGLPTYVTVTGVTLLDSINQQYTAKITNNTKHYIYNYVGDGIYKFTLEYVNPITGSKTTETKCIAVLDDIKCLIPNHIITNKKSIAHLILYSIENSIDCNCICDDLCNLYNSLIEDIKWNNAI